MKIILAGGGTIGSVNPLLAIREKILEREPAAEFIWLGTKDGIEKEILTRENLPYFGIAGAKWRRYFSWQTILDPWRLLIGFFQSAKIILKFKPDIILSAGSFVSVPVILAGWLLRRRTVIHQQDIKPGLANKIMAPFATKITITFDLSLKYFSKDKTVLTGNPVRSKMKPLEQAAAKEFFNLEDGLPTLLVMGGSLGAEQVNKLLFEAVTRLIEFCQIIHIAGRGNLVDWTDKDKFGAAANRYHSFEYLHEEMASAYAAADLVFCRAGLSTLTELSYLAKSVILMPIPNNQQEENAAYFDGKNAVVTIDQTKTTSSEFVEVVRELLENKNSLARLRENIGKVMIREANDNYYKVIENLLA